MAIFIFQRPVVLCISDEITKDLTIRAFITKQIVNGNNRSAFGTADGRGTEN